MVNTSRSTTVYSKPALPAVLSESPNVPQKHVHVFPFFLRRRRKCGTDRTHEDNLFLSVILKRIEVDTLSEVGIVSLTLATQYWYSSFCKRNISTTVTADRLNRHAPGVYDCCLWWDGRRVVCACKARRYKRPGVPQQNPYVYGILLLMNTSASFFYLTARGFQSFLLAPCNKRMCVYERTVYFKGLTFETEENFAPILWFHHPFNKNQRTSQKLILQYPWVHAIIYSVNIITS